MKRVLVLLLCFCLFLAGCGSAEPTEPPTTETTEPPLTIEEYAKMVSESADKIESDSLGVGNLIVREIKFLANFNQISGKTEIPDTTLEKSLTWIEENSDYTKESMERTYEENCAAYKGIALVKAPEGAEKIWELYDSFFTAYMNLHKLALNPSGSIKTFSDNGGEYLKTMSEVKPQLDILVSD